MAEASSRPLKVFLCHSSGDKLVVRELYRQLSEESWIDVWLDEEKLLPGQEWDLEIEKAVEDANIVLVCLSTRSVDKEGYIQKELRFVLNIAEEKPEGLLFVIPLRLDDCVVPRRLRHWQWVDYYPKERQSYSYLRLLESLKVRARKLGITVTQQKRQISSHAGITTTASDPELPARKEDVIPNTEPASRDVPLPKGVLSSGVAEKKKTGSNTNIRLVVGMLVLILAVFLITRIIPKFLNQPPVATATTEATITPTQPTLVTLTSISIATPDMVFLQPKYGKDGMTLLYVPAGTFLMGDDNGNPDQKPAHTVFLNAYWVDKTEVTNKMYSLCVESGVCKEPSNKSSASRSSYYGNSLFDNYPVIYVDWYMAKTYCEWVERRLPSEAEWEKAASWDVKKQQKRVYPWGDTIDYCLLSNSSKQDGHPCVGDTTEVGKYRNGASSYAILDLAGNVWEWVEDWYDAYPGNTASNAGYGTINRLLRGGSWVSNFPSTYRYMSAPTYTQHYIGFRCAMAATP